jgi:transposase
MEMRMSQKERDRLKVVVQVEAGHIGQAEAGAMLGMTARHVRRLVANYRRDGDVALVHKNRGRASNRRLAETTKAQAKELLKSKYADFGPLLASEQLEERDGIKASRETVRTWMKELKLWGGRRKGRPHRRRRQRRACFGILVQMDTSDHDWLEGRGARMMLITMIDDATGWKLQRFAPSDTSAANMAMIKLWIERYGRFMELYTDHAGHFRRMRAVGEKEGQTQIERALGALGIRLIVAHSPQAKGRVERSHGTDQDRLIKLMRLEGISTLEDANEFLEKVYLPKVNEKFSVAAREALDMHRSAEGYDLGAILSHQEERSVALDWTIQVDGKVWQLEAATARDLPARSKVIVERRLDGTMRIRWGERYLSYKLAPTAPHPVMHEDEDEDEENDTMNEVKKVTPKGVGERRGYAPPSPHPLANP